MATYFKTSALAGAAVGLVLASFGGVAHAQDSGVYVRGNAGLGVFTEGDLTGDIDSSIHGDGVQAESNLALSFGLGYETEDNWRFELDLDSLYNDMGTIGNASNTIANLRTTSVMINAIYDFDAFGAVEPYIGAGLGVVRAEPTFAAHDFNLPTGIGRNVVCSGSQPGQAYSCDFNQKTDKLGFQLLAGLGVAVTDNMTWDTHYTYQDAGDLNFDGIRTAFPSTNTEAINTSLENVSAHTLMTGFRYRFGASAPAVVPVAVVPTTYTCWDGMTEVTDRSLCPPRPAPVVTCWDGSTAASLDLCPPEPVMVTCPDGVTMVSDLAACPIIQPVAQCGEQFRQDIIYYEFDRAQSAETRNAINRVMDVGQFCQISSIRVVGHTDTSGAASYNMRLSQRRASDAQAELVRQGVSATSITSQGKGETEPAVQTGDGVRNAQNRRTEILVTLSELGGMMMTN